MLLCCPLTAETRGLLGAAELALLQPGAVLVNVARAEVIEEDALHARLCEEREGKPTLAFGSDVWWHEPAFNESNTAMDVQPSVKYDWSKFENVVMTPHFGPRGGLIFKR